MSSEPPPDSLRHPSRRFADLVAENVALRGQLDELLLTIREQAEVVAMLLADSGKCGPISAECASCEILARSNDGKTFHTTVLTDTGRIFKISSDAHRVVWRGLAS